MEIDLLTIEGNWTRTKGDNPQEFMIHDNRNNGNRIIAFGSRTALQALSASTKWFVDGNFSLAPNGFAQLYVIRVPLATSAVTTVYALLQRKTVETYTELINMVIEKCVDHGFTRPNPQVINCDFEIAMHTAIRLTFNPNTRIQGCFYHLTQVSTLIKRETNTVANCHVPSID